MPERVTMRRAQRDKRQGKAASTQAGEFVREEMDHIRAGKHGARSAKQAIAIGLSKARRAGVDLEAPAKGNTSAATRRKAKRDYARGHRSPAKRANTIRRQNSSETALKRESRRAASHTALSRQASAAARRRSASSRSAAAKKAARTRKSER
jgi:hypothetical protein